MATNNSSNNPSFHPEDCPCDSSDPLTAHFFEVLALREALKYSASIQDSQNFLERPRSPSRKVWLLFPLFMASHALVWFFTYLSTGGIDGTMALKFFNSNRQQIEFCQKPSLPTCSLDTPVMDKLVDRTPF
jgi:hypothetical protein